MKLRIKTIFPIFTALAMLNGVTAAPKISDWQTITAENTCTARHETTAVTVDDVFYLIGGRGMKPVEAYDPKTNRWTKKSTPPPMEFHHLQAVLVDGRIIAAGGRRTHTEEKNIFNLTVAEVDVYDIAADRWSTLAKPIPTPRAGAPTLVRDGRVIVIGGESGTQASANGEVEALTPVTGDWESLPMMGDPRHSGGAAFVQDDLYYAAGCSSRGGGNERSTIEKLSWCPAANK